MIKITIKKYMIIDLAMLIVFGSIVEAIALFVIPRMFNNAFPFFCVSLLICVLAIARWGWKGIVVIPIMSFVSVLFGKLWASTANSDSIHELAKYYGWRVFLTNMISFSVSASIILVKKLLKKKETLSDRAVTIVVTICMILACYVLQVLAFSLVTLAAPKNYIGVFAINDLPAFMVTLVFVVVLRHQGMFVDAKQDLINKKEEAEMENKYYKELRKNVIEKSSDEDSSSKK